jgi:bacteriorhodopsin
MGGGREAVTEFQLVLVMAMLSFPACVLIWALHGLGMRLGLLPYGMAALVSSWALFFLAGYIQWFIALPWIYRRRRGG